MNNSVAKLLKTHTTLIALVGATIGKTGLLKFECATNQNIAGLYPKYFELLNPIYLFYITQTLYSKFLNLGKKKFRMANLSFVKEQKIPLPPMEVQEEIVALMEKAARLEVQTKNKLRKQDEFSKSSMYFIAQAQNKKEISHHWGILKNNFKDVLYSESGAKEFKAMIFQLALKGKLDFQKLSEGQIKKSLQILVTEQKDYLKKEGILFEEKLNNVWPTVKLGDFCNIMRGGSPRPIQNYITRDEAGINWIKIGDVAEGKKYITKTKQKIKREGIGKTRLVKSGDFIFSNSMSFGRPYIVKIDGAIHDGWLLIRIKNIKKLYSNFLSVLDPHFAYTPQKKEGVVWKSHQS